MLPLEAEVGVDPGRRRRLVPAVAGCGVVVGAVGDTALSAVSGFLFLAAGLAAHLRRPANGTGLLMVLVGVAFFAEDLQLHRRHLERYDTRNREFVGRPRASRALPR